MVSKFRGKRWLRFVIGGVVNAAFSYFIYWIFNILLNYQVAYLIAYVSGVFFSYWFNARIVFCVPLSWSGLLSFPAVYLVQYFVSALILAWLIEMLEVSELLAPLVVASTMIPVTYLMAKFILEGKNREKKTILSPD